MAARLRKVRLKSGDSIVVISGSEKGKRGKILRIDMNTGRAIVEGVNLVQRHRKQTRTGGPSGIVQQPSAIHLSNIALIDPHTGFKTKVGFRFGDDGQKLRVARKSGELIS